MLLDRPPAVEHDEIAGRFTRLVEDVDATPADWTRPSPVDEWTARDVVAHLTEWVPGFLQSFAGVAPAPTPAAVDDPAGAWRALDDGLRTLLANPGDRIVRLPHAEPTPLAEAIIRYITADVFMHTWDLARATGRDATLDPRRCEILVSGMESIEELMRSSGQFGTRVEVPADAGPQDRLLGFIGRDPAWRPAH